MRSAAAARRPAAGTWGRASTTPACWVASAAAVKGLEFDGVIVADASAAQYAARVEDAKLLYVALTPRAWHHLCVFYADVCTPLLDAQRWVKRRKHMKTTPRGPLYKSGEPPGRCFLRAYSSAANCTRMSPMSARTWRGILPVFLLERRPIESVPMRFSIHSQAAQIRSEIQRVGAAGNCESMRTVPRFAFTSISPASAPERSTSPMSLCTSIVVRTAPSRRGFPCS